MSKERILRNHHDNCFYDINDWALLEQKRKKAKDLMEIFVKEGLNPFIYGSVARGNVHKFSDIDIIFLQQIPSYKIEYVLGKNGYNTYVKEIIMATPHDSLKLNIYLSELECITLPLTKMDNKSIEFFDFGGKINFEQLKLNLRVPGIDKRLVLVKPNQKGHEEISVIDNEILVSKETGISIRSINERIKVLLKREKYGRTGVFLKRQLQQNETPEEVIKKIARKKSIIRKKIYLR